MTLAELMIVFVIVAMLLTLGLIRAYRSYTKKAWEAQKKSDLAVIRNIVEEYYSDYRRYPPVVDMTYEYMHDTQLAGKLCGYKKTGTNIKKYINELPCNPNSPTSDYVYFSWNNGQEYAVFTLLDLTVESGNKNELCPYGCSYFTNANNPKQTVSSNQYNYFVSSTAETVGCNLADVWVCYPGITNPCRSCPNLQGCNPDYSGVFCTRSWCVDSCKAQ